MSRFVITHLAAVIVIIYLFQRRSQVSQHVHKRNLNEIKFVLYESREGSSDFRLPTSNFQLPTSNFRLPNGARLPLLKTDWVGLKSLLIWMRRWVEFCVLITFLYLGYFRHIQGRSVHIRTYARAYSWDLRKNFFSLNLLANNFIFSHYTGVFY